VSDPVSWFLIDSGWKVVGSDGADLGKVAEVVGDPGSDIFNGLSVSPGLLHGNRYVAAEWVGTITEGRVEVELDTAAFERLGAHEERPPG
jgi:hypothetical protein